MKDTTNNIMELTAVITALEYVLEILKKENRPYTICIIEINKLTFAIPNKAQYKS